MNFIDIAIASGVFIFILFAFHLLTLNKGNSLLNKLFAFFLLSRGIQNIFILIIEHNQQFPFYFIGYLFPLLMVTTPSVIYLYVRSSVKDATKLYKKDLFHLVPSVILIISIILLNKNGDRGDFLNSMHKTIDLNNSNEFKRVFLLFGYRLVLNIFYIILSWKLIKKAVANKSHSLNKFIKNWLIFLVSILTIFFSTNVLFAIYILINHLQPSSLFGNIYLVSLVSIVMFSLIFYIIKQPIILYGHLAVLENSKIAQIVNEPITESHTVLDQSIPYSLLTDEQTAIYMRKFQAFIASNKPYLDTELTIAKFASDIEIPLHHCSYFLNTVLHMSFRDYVNQFRVNYFINEYPNKVATMTIESMAEQAGFKNRSTFNIAFKKETGLTPSEYFSKTPTVYI
ncbi:MAG: AraC family transcriptional regulator [Sediminibacterium sp.]|nr:MAG: AraC family transcriptional regulator [Sediminibacterium sp.]